MKINRFIHALLVVMCVLFCNIVASQAENAASKEAGKEIIFSYVNDNRESLLSSMEEIESWSQKYYILFSDGGRIEGGIVEWPYNRQYVIEDSISKFFGENVLIHNINFPANSDLVVFETKGMGMVSSSVDMGFYFSLQDKPAWINSEQLKPYGIETGQYLEYPMIQEGNGWVPDTSVLDPENDVLLKSYGLYTERICENFFYFESWY